MLTSRRAPMGACQSGGIRKGRRSAHNRDVCRLDTAALRVDEFLQTPRRGLSEMAVQFPKQRLSSQGGLTMKIMERLIQKVDRTSWSKKIAIEKRYEVIEARLGFPPSRRYRAFIGANETNTRVIERDWSSQGAYLATIEKALADPEWQALGAEQVGIVLSNQVELYMVES